MALHPLTEIVQRAIAQDSGENITERMRLIENIVELTDDINDNSLDILAMARSTGLSAPEIHRLSDKLNLGLWIDSSSYQGRRMRRWSLRDVYEIRLWLKRQR